MVKSLQKRVPWLVLAFALAAFSSTAAPNETNSFSASANLFQDTFYDRAEAGFSNFVATYTNSVHRSLAILYEARSRFYQSNYVGAIDLLQRNMTNAMGSADDYQFWIARSLFAKPDYRAAADAFGVLLKNYPRSSHQLEGAFLQAKAFSVLNEWPKVIDLLGKPDGHFQTAARNQPDSPVGVDGFLLLAEALFRQHRNADAEQVVRAMNVDPSMKEANCVDTICSAAFNSPPAKRKPR